MCAQKESFETPYACLGQLLMPRHRATALGMPASSPDMPTSRRGILSEAFASVWSDLLSSLNKVTSCPARVSSKGYVLWGLRASQTPNASSLLGYSPLQLISSTNMSKDQISSGNDLLEHFTSKSQLLSVYALSLPKVETLITTDLVRN